MYARRYIWLAAIVTLIMAASCKESKSDFFKRDAALYTERYCPNTFEDGITVLDSMVFDDGQEPGELQVYYTLNLDSTFRGELMKKVDDIWKENLNYVVNATVFVKHKEYGVSFKFVYYDKETGQLLFENVIDKEDYQR